MYRSIQKLQKKQEDRQKEFYKKIIKAVKETITRAIQNEQTKCFYQVPMLTFGEPINDLDYVMKTLKKYLKKEHIKMKHIDGLLVHLDWSRIEKTANSDLDSLYKKYA